MLSLYLFVCFMVTAVSSGVNDTFISVDNQGRMHIGNENDVIITNVSIQELFNTVTALNASLEEEMVKNQQLQDSFQQALSVQGRQLESLNQQIEEALAADCHLGETPFNVTAARESKLVAADGEPSEYFGRTVAATANTIVVGAYFDNNKAGSAYVFEKNSSGAYTQVAKLVADDGTADDFFGLAVAVTEGGGGWSIWTQ
eukprot:m.31723 g.31723  ORF g.31723 m.31723 type:complete len:201 (+) comp12095_c0_seq2:166-768(+)